MPTEQKMYRKAASELEGLSDQYIELAEQEEDSENREVDWIWAAAMRGAAMHLREQARGTTQTSLEKAISAQMEEGGQAEST